VDISHFLANPNKVQRVDAMPSRLDLAARLCHCGVTESLILRYRAKYTAIVAFWQYLDQVITHMIQGDEILFGAHGVIKTGKEKLHLPGGLVLRYPHLERDGDGNSSYYDGRKRTRLYGGLLLENLCQALHRVIVCEQMLEISKELRVALTTHDDVACVVNENDAELALQFMVQTMSTSPAWATGLPMKGEGWVGDNLLGPK
jgi:DNA polymerase